MSPEAAQLLIALFFAHFLLDFPLQPRHWVDERYERHAGSGKLYLHTLAHGLAVGVCLSLFGGASPAQSLLGGGAVFLAHFLTDLGKSFLPRASLVAFVGDQFLHWLVLLAVWAGVTGFGVLPVLLGPLMSAKTLLLLLAYILVLLPTSVVVSLCLQPWVKELEAAERGEQSLTKAGAMIGYLERLLILTFVLVGEYTAIGFVMALKTAFRFKDTDDRRKAEYMMMGTFLSFTLTIGVGLLVKSVMSHL